MGSKKWFSVAALTAAVAGVAAVAVAKAKRAPEAASDTYESVRSTVRESPQKATAVVDAAKERMRRNGNDAESDDSADEEPADDTENENPSADTKS